MTDLEITNSSTILSPKPPKRALSLINTFVMQKKLQVLPLFLFVFTLSIYNVSAFTENSVHHKVCV
jgi:hypothetical protein